MRYFPVLLTLFFARVAAKDYNDNEKVPLYVNKVGPYANPHETYHYYQLPVCRPEKVVHKSLSLGQILEGDRMAESLYEIHFQHEKEKTPLCGKKKLSAEEVKQLVEAVEENYYFEFIIDDLPIRGYLGRLDEEGIFPHEHKVYLFTHHHFVIQFNGFNVISARIDVSQVPPLRLDTKMGDVDVEFTYSVSWEMTRQEYKDRHGEGDGFFSKKTMEIHWLSVINSTLLVFLLVGFVALILVSVVKRDLTQYNNEEDRKDEMLIDNGWKTVNTDVFRFPQNANLFCAIQGVGCQLLTIVVTILIIGSFNLINVHRHGLINTLAVAFYALTSGIAGYISASLYRKLNGDSWIWNINLTSALFAVPVFLVWAVSNSLSWAYQSTQALPYTTVIIIFLIWLLVGYPLTVVGGIMGKNFGGRYDAPCRTRNIPRELPLLPWYHSSGAFALVGGFLPFSAISVELYYIFATVWGHETYTLFYILLIVFVILLAVVACVSVALTYFQLAAEDYRWWWRSIIVGGSVGAFVMVYSVFFYFRRSEMSGLLQTTEYFGYVTLVCYAFSLALGTVSFMASHKFVRYIYASVKND
uniref:Transmembrane 9 superfamily member n=1 Tax=Plectus sambesii TaxID=2011161 RepID=A0A914WN04_9BILA